MTTGKVEGCWECAKMRHQCQVCRRNITHVEATEEGLCPRCKHTVSRETVKVRAYELVPGNVIVWSNGTRGTVEIVERESVLKRRYVYVVTFEESDILDAPARFSQDDIFDVERVN